MTPGYLHSSNDRPPENFKPLPDRAEPEMFSGPFYIGETAGKWQLGFRVQPRHLNRMGACHGGVLAVFADLQGHALKKTENLQVDSPTINLSLDFVAPVLPDAWVQSEPICVKRTGSMLFFQALILANDQVAVRTSGIYRLKSTYTALDGQD